MEMFVEATKPSPTRGSPRPLLPVGSISWCARGGSSADLPSLGGKARGERRTKQRRSFGCRKRRAWTGKESAVGVSFLPHPRPPPCFSPFPQAGAGRGWRLQLTISVTRHTLYRNSEAAVGAALPSRRPHARAAGTGPSPLMWDDEDASGARRVSGRFRRYVLRACGVGARRVLVGSFFPTVSLTTSPTHVVPLPSLRLAAFVPLVREGEGTREICGTFTPALDLEDRSSRCDQSSEYSISGSSLSGCRDYQPPPHRLPPPPPVVLFPSPRPQGPPSLPPIIIK